MPPVTQAEKREAAAHLSSCQSKKQRVTEPAIATEVARRRILRGAYGSRTASNNCVKEAGDDLGLSERQRKELSRQLKGEPLPVRTLDSFFARVEDSAATQPPDEAMTDKARRIEELTQQYTEKADPLDTDPWEAPARRARGCYAAELLGVAHRQLLLGDDWLQANTPTLLKEAEQRGTALIDFIGCYSPVEMDDEDEDSGHLRRCLGLWVNPSTLWPETILYSRPPSPVESTLAQEQRLERHCLREEKALLQFERDLRYELKRELAKARDAARARGPGQREREVNIAAVAALGLPTLTLSAGSLDMPSLPAVLSEAFASGLQLQARIVDFWAGSRAERRAIRQWLESLGFDVTVTDDSVQIGAACGYISARATGIMFAAGSEWRSVSVADAVEETWISLGNALLENGWVSDGYLEVQHVYMLAQMFHEHVFSLPHQLWDPSSQAFASMSWPLRVGALDWVARGISEALMTYVGCGTGADTERAFFVTNTRESHSEGSHWISVAISMQY
jgi:hypothetical protein